ncbi:hypothetical protein V497_07112 [Pseudogymnoascus sp. VKM F-4516 (FW-969)]|nr:hypothetical protein V497_07112 [Pseudogymnoascus sp. VKM F-4516 (FW-969)]
MSSNHDSFQHRPEDDRHYSAMEMLGPKAKIFTKWFREYMAADGNNLSYESDIIQAVVSDELDAKFVEQRILELVPDAPIVNGFCSKCQNLFDHWPTIGDSSTWKPDSKPNSDGGWEHAIGWRCSTFELEGSTRSGCRFCALLLQNLKDCNLLATFRKIEARLYHLHENALSSLSIQNWFKVAVTSKQILWLNLPGKICTSSNSGIATSMSIDSCFLTESADCYDDPLTVFDIARNWLSKCTESHDLCKKSGNDILPTRLISITGESARLVLTSEWLARPRYATLSHCWGSGNAIKLTSKDLDTYMEALPVERFPKTFKEAIEITKKLGIDYLWIDSLCIIQDSVDDWQNESALMGSVYGCSTITIAASSARDSSQGCFMKPPYFSGGLRARITDAGLRRVQDFRDMRAYDLSTINSHLATRAWTVQEKILSPRAIHFGNRGALWECKTKIASEYLPDGFPAHLFAPLVIQRGEFQVRWPQIVSLYSEANLTFGKDKLPALSGVARLGYNETGDQYLAGLWKSKLEEQLCWCQYGSALRPRPPWRAPTWSWASIDGPVSWLPRQRGVLESTCVQVLDANTAKCGYDPFGQVTSGVIRLACATMATGYLVHLGESHSPKPEEYAVIVSYAGTRELRISIDMDCQDDSNRTPHELVYLLPILSGKSGNRKVEGLIYELIIKGIVLQATGVTKGELSRVGYFAIYKDPVIKRNGNDGGETYEQFLSILKEHGTVTAEEACTEVISNPKDLDKRYVVTLV